MTGPRLAGRIIHEYETTPINLGGVRSASTHRRRTRRPDHLTRQVPRNIIIGKNVASTEVMNEMMCERLRDNLWFRGKRRFQANNCYIPPDIWDQHRAPRTGRSVSTPTTSTASAPFT